jgi:hypothetical protein
MCHAPARPSAVRDAADECRRNNRHTVCVCVCVRARARVCVCVRVCVRAHMYTFIYTPAPRRNTLEGGRGAPIWTSWRQCARATPSVGAAAATRTYRRRVTRQVQHATWNVNYAMRPLCAIYVATGKNQYVSHEQYGSSQQAPSSRQHGTTTHNLPRATGNRRHEECNNNHMQHATTTCSMHPTGNRQHGSCNTQQGTASGGLRR